MAGRRRKRRAVREAGRRRDDEEREKENTARLRGDASPRQARSVTPRPEAGRSRLRRWLRRGRQDGQTADGGPAGGGKKEAAGGRSEQGQRPSGAIRRRTADAPEGLWRVKASGAFSADARRPPPGGRRKRSPAPAGRATTGAAQRRPCQARRSAGRGRRGAERGTGSSRRDSFAGAAGAGTASPTTPGPGTYREPRQRRA